MSHQASIGSVRDPPLLYFPPLRLLNFDFNARSDPDPAFRSNADPDQASKNNADPCRSATPKCVSAVDSHSEPYLVVVERAFLIMRGTEYQ